MSAVLNTALAPKFQALEVTNAFFLCSSYLQNLSPLSLVTLLWVFDLRILTQIHPFFSTSLMSLHMYLASMSTFSSAFTMSEVYGFHVPCFPL